MVSYIVFIIFIHLFTPTGHWLWTTPSQENFPGEKETRKASQNKKIGEINILLWTDIVHYRFLIIQIIKMTWPIKPCTSFLKLKWKLKEPDLFSKNSNRITWWTNDNLASWGKSDFSSVFTFWKRILFGLWEKLGCRGNLHSCPCNEFKVEKNLIIDFCNVMF